MNKLSKEDLTDLNWEHLGFGWYNYKGEFGNLGYWTHVRLREWGDNSAIIGYRGDPKSYPDTENDYLYQGKLGDKEYFTKLMYMINLHNQE